MTPAAAGSAPSLPAGLLVDVQRSLEALYALPAEAPVTDFVIPEEQIRAAKAVCSECAVRDACLEWSLATFQDAGVWGGLDEEERRAIRRRRRQDATLAVV